MIYIGITQNQNFYGSSLGKTVEVPISYVLQYTFEKDTCSPKGQFPIDLYVLLNLSDKYISADELDDPLQLGYPNIFHGTTSEETLWIDALGAIKLEIFNLEDLGITRAEGADKGEVAGYVVKNMNLRRLKKLIKGKNAFTQSASFSPIVHYVLNELGNKISIYRRSYLNISKDANKNSDYNWVMEQNVPDYLEFGNLFISQTPSNSLHHYGYKIPHRFVHCLDNRKLPWLPYESNPHEKFCNDFLDLLSGAIKRVVFIGSDNSFINYLLAELEKKSGPFTKQDAIDGGDGVFLNGNAIFIKNAHKLEVRKLNQLLLIANTDSYKNKLIVLQSPVLLKSLKEINFKVIFVPRKELIEDKLSVIIAYFFTECFSDSVDDLSLDVLDSLDAHSFDHPVVIDIFKKIPTFADLEEEILSLKNKSNFTSFSCQMISEIDFLWEFKNYIKEKYNDTNISESSETSILRKNDRNNISVTLKDQFDTQVTEWSKYSLGGGEDTFPPEKIFTFEHVGNYWIIKNPQLEDGILKEDYTSLPIRYLAYLAKLYYDSGEKVHPVDYKKLYAKMTKGNKTKLTSKNPSPNIIYTNIHSFFYELSNQNKKNCKNGRIKLGKLILEYFTLKDKCSFDPLHEIKIIVRDDEEVLNIN
jgi:hypothetical protein